MSTLGVITQAVDEPDDLRLIAYISGSFSDMQQRWSASWKGSFEVYQSVLKFDLYLRGAECTLCCEHKQLESFLSKGMEILNLDQWAMELTDYNKTFVYIKNSNNM